MPGFELDFWDCVTFATLALGGAGFFVTNAGIVRVVFLKLRGLKFSIALARADCANGTTGLRGAASFDS